MLTFTLIVVAELLLLLRLILPGFIAFAEARHNEVYRVPYGDCAHLPCEMRLRSAKAGEVPRTTEPVFGNEAKQTNSQSNNSNVHAAGKLTGQGGI